METPDSDYPEIGEFVYKYKDLLFSDKLPVGEEKNIARVLLEYQQKLEYIFEYNIRYLFDIIMYYCTDEKYQNISTILEIKYFITHNFLTIKSKYIKESISDEELQKIWSTTVKDTILPEKLPEELSINNFTSSPGYLNILTFLQKYTVKDIDLYYI